MLESLHRCKLKNATNIKQLSQDSTWDFFQFFKNFFSKIWVAKFELQFIFECSLSASVYNNNI